jgi:WD40 repeat protein
MLMGRDCWIIQDAMGAIWKLDPNEEHQLAENLYSFHSGAIVAMDTSPCKHIASTAGSDGTVRIYNYKETRLLASKKFSTAATALVWCPTVIISQFVRN